MEGVWVTFSGGPLHGVVGRMKMQPDDDMILVFDGHMYKVMDSMNDLGPRLTLLHLPETLPPDHPLRRRNGHVSKAKEESWKTRAEKVIGNGRDPHLRSISSRNRTGLRSPFRS